MELKNKPHAKGTKALFKNKFMERLTRTHIAIPLVVFSVISIGLMVYGFQQSYLNTTNAILLFIGGFMGFTLVEYLMHRFVFHLTPSTEKREKFAYTVHGVHHDYPKDKDRLAMPIPLSLTLSTVFFLLFQLIMGVHVFAFLPGFLMGYAYYLWIHYMVHAYQPPKNFWKVLWVHHGIHHYKDPGNAFGVSSPFWDVVFGTMPKK
ncbi:Fatty acid hydroxylase superfamily protein [Ekhidna lutea]|uniref:Fatty acid hydroxylase superfamily protein n=1 Tax=Ekhidna lutea TaxID=447679 RepID=A0A239IKI2_EKHLU|nr:sterol desaturase family protein [Ekhidna lutea]SNS93922.1 Fatty acid hydroxylase superfamily protein [Ekhidna lutea]